MAWKSWSTLEVRKAVEMRQDRYTIAAIARHLGRTYEGVAYRLRKSGLARPTSRWRKNGSLAKAVQKMCGPGVSDTDIAVRLGVRREQVYLTRKRLGIPAGVSVGGCVSPNKRRTKIVRCFHCDEMSRHCGRGTSLASQGWWSKRGPAGYENYCSGCVKRYGTPETWGAGR